MYIVQYYYLAQHSLWHSLNHLKALLKVLRKVQGISDFVIEDYRMKAKTRSGLTVKPPTPSVFIVRTHNLLKSQCRCCCINWFWVPPLPL